MKKTLLLLAVLACETAFAAQPNTPSNKCDDVQEIELQLLNGWENYGGPFKRASYYKDCVGVVHIAGGIKHPTLQNPPSQAFVMPAGYIPTAHEIFVAATTAYRPATVYINPDGWVDVMSSTGTYVSLSGITYRAKK